MYTNLPALSYFNIVRGNGSGRLSLFSHRYLKKKPHSFCSITCVRMGVLYSCFICRCFFRNQSLKFDWGNLCQCHLCKNKETAFAQQLKLRWKLIADIWCVGYVQTLQTFFRGMAMFLIICNTIRPLFHVSVSESGCVSVCVSGRYQCGHPIPRFSIRQTYRPVCTLL